MLFNSLEFCFFFLVVTGLYFLLPHRYRWFLLLVASCYFYMAFVPIYILILGFTIVVDYFAGIYIEKQEGRKRKLALIASIIANVGVLCFFKYWNFLNANLTEFLGLFSAENPVPFLKILLPIGLSFHTFQAMSYTIEVYRGNQKAEKHFGIYSLYVMFYPQLVAGPIERPQNLLHQFREEHFFEYKRVVQGLRLMLWGLFKKMVIADRLAIYVEDVFDHPGEHHGIAVLTAAAFFAVQIYCDFSGYSDIARGSAKVMGFDLMVNFNLPFWSKSITEFWRRWHISLSTWFNDYLYTPFVVRFRDWGVAAVVLGLMLTFFTSGLWHGAGWTFITFGVLHGIAVAYELLTKKWRKSIAKKFPSWLANSFSMFLTLSFVVGTMIFFRAKTFHEALVLFKNLIRVDLPANWYDTDNLVHLVFGIFFIAVLFIVEFIYSNNKIEENLSRLSTGVRWSLYVTTLLIILWFGVFTKNEFIYFQF